MVEARPSEKRLWKVVCMACMKSAGPLKVQISLWLSAGVIPQKFAKTDRKRVAHGKDLAATLPVNQPNFWANPSVPCMWKVWHGLDWIGFTSHLRKHGRHSKHKTEDGSSPPVINQQGKIERFCKIFSWKTAAGTYMCCSRVLMLMVTLQDFTQWLNSVKPH